MKAFSVGSPTDTEGQERVNVPLMLKLLENEASLFRMIEAGGGGRLDEAFARNAAEGFECAMRALRERSDLRLQSRIREWLEERGCLSSCDGYAVLDGVAEDETHDAALDRLTAEIVTLLVPINEE